MMPHAAEKRSRCPSWKTHHQLRRLESSARLVVLDTSEDGLTSAQLKWLRLALSTDKVKLVFMHKPPDGLWQWTLGGVGGFTVRSREFMDLMAEKGVDRVYMGHVHGFGH